jgi:hypothetical protein
MTSENIPHGLQRNRFRFPKSDSTALARTPRAMNSVPAAARILSRLDYFQMVGIHTSTNRTQMV